MFHMPIVESPCPDFVIRLLKCTWIPAQGLSIPTVLEAKTNMLEARSLPRPVPKIMHNDVSLRTVTAQVRVKTRNKAVVMLCVVFERGGSPTLQPASTGNLGVLSTSGNDCTEPQNPVSITFVFNKPLYFNKLRNTAKNKNLREPVKMLRASPGGSSFNPSANQRLPGDLNPP